MKAIMEAREMYLKLGRNFEQDLGWYLVNGIVLNYPDRFIMAKPIVAARGDDEWNAKDPDCWYVHCAVGKQCLQWFLAQAPFRLPLLAWRRVKDTKINALKVYPTDRFARFST